MTFKIDVTVIGTGRVGLPLALCFLNLGLRVNGIDIDERLIRFLKKGRMPFAEPGCQEMLDRYGLSVDNDFSKIRDSEYLIITVGTPLRQHVEVDMDHIRDVMDRIAPYVRKGQTIILRSTVAPRATEYVKRYLASRTGWKIGKEICLAYCPERIAEGKALDEITTLPQIIGAADPESAKKAKELFGKLTDKVFLTDTVSAELAKLFSNISRYVYFAVSNHFMMLADQFDANIYEILEMTNTHYPRQILSSPGFTAGTCLRKDFGMINEHIPFMDLLLSSWKINEFVPQFLVSHILKRTPIHKRNIAVLGYTFKKDSDDSRDSLSPKLIRYIQREVPRRIRVCEPNLETGMKLENGMENETVEAVLTDADIVFITVNHSAFEDGISLIRDCCKKETWFADVWNMGGAGKLFYQNREVL